MFNATIFSFIGSHQRVTIAPRKMASPFEITRYLCALVLLLGGIGVQCTSFMCDSNLEKLLAMENDLIQISHYLLRQESAIHGDEDVHGLFKINSTVEGTKVIHKRIGRKKPAAYLAHPINVYHLVKRLNEQWGDVVKTIIDSDYCHEALEVRMQNILDNIPSAEEVREAARTMVKLQYYHDIDLDDMARGKIQGRDPLESVTPDEVFEIGKYAYELEDYYNAILWLEKATEILKSLPADQASDVSFNETNTLSMIASSYYKLRRLSQAVAVLDELIKKEPGNSRVKQTKAYYQERVRQYGDIKEPPKRPLPKDKEVRVYERLCRGETLKSTRTLSRLTCHYQATWKKFIRVKAEVMNLDPLVLVLHDVANADTSEAIKYMGYRQMTRTALEDKFRHSFPSVTVHDRTSWGWLKKVETRYNELEGLLYSPMHQSPFEVRNFAMTTTMDRPRQPLATYSQGGEVGNFVLFLTDVKAGGEIVLPRSKTLVKSQRGSVVFFYATKDYVGVCPTLYGSQWLSWKTYYEQPAHYCRLTEAPKHKLDY